MKEKRKMVSLKMFEKFCEGSEKNIEIRKKIEKEFAVFYRKGNENGVDGSNICYRTIKYPFFWFFCILKFGFE